MKGWKKRKGMMRISPFLALLFLLSLMTGCLSGEASLILAENGALRGDFSYRVAREMVGIGLVGEEVLLIPIPLRQESFQRSPYWTLNGYQEGVDIINISAALTIPNPSEADLPWFRRSDSLQFNPDDKSARLLLWESFSQGIDPVTQERLPLLPGDSLWEVTLTLPGPVLDFNRGERGPGGNTLRLTLDYEEIITDNNDLWWEVTWQ